MATRWDKLTPEQRFWLHVDKRGPDECWEWTASCQPKGYGVFNIGDGTLVRTHRFAYELVHGPTTKWVLHKCDNRKCVNERHLFAGTHRENMKDMRDKGRSGKKLNEIQVSLIKLYITNGRNHREIASRFGVNRSAITAIANGRNFRDVKKWRFGVRFTPEMWKLAGGRLGLDT
jgi:hypothetical protein